MRIVLIVFIFSTLVSCLKTTDQIRKDRVVQGLPTQVEQSQKLMAQMTLRMNELENRLQSYNGNIEEIEYRQQKTIPSTQKEIQNKLISQDKEIKSMRSSLMKNEKDLSVLKSMFEKQKKYITKVNQSLANFSKPTKRTTIAKTNNAKSLVSGLSLYKRKKYTDAKKKLLYALKNDRLNSAEKNQVYQALGHIEFAKKNYGQSNIYFSKIFTKYPKSTMAPDALIHMARAFHKQKNNSAAKEAYRTFKNEYPKHNLIKTADKELNAL